MDKYEYKVKADEIKELIVEGEYGLAAEIADGIDWRRVKSVMMLCTISDLYKINKRYEDAKNMLLLAYDRRPGGRTICYSLCELCIKTGDLVQALNSYKEFVQVAPRDSGRYILQYKLYVAQEVGLSERIGVLEELKKRDYREKWAYELALLYHKAELGARCVEECDELIACFGYGRYVIKAMELKMLYQPLTSAQQETYDHRFDAHEDAVQEAEQSEYYEEEAAYDGQEVYNQEGYADRQSYAGEEAYAQGDPAAESSCGGEGGYSQEGYGTDGGFAQEGYASDGGYGQDEGYNGNEEYVQEENYSHEDSYGSGENYGQASGQPEEASDELDIQVKTVDVGRFNTINLQAELAAGLQEVLGEESAEFTHEESQTGEEIHPEQKEEESSAGGVQKPKEDDKDAKAAGETAYRQEEIDEESYEDINWQEGETEEEDSEEAGEEADLPEEGAEEARDWQEGENGEEIDWPEETVEEAGDWQEGEAGEEARKESKPGQMRDQTAEQVMEQMRLEHTGEIPVQDSGKIQQSGKIVQMPGVKNQEKSVEEQTAAAKKTFVEEILAQMPPKELAGVLSQESDGQIGFVLPEKNVLEKQITGQMKIEDILAEWERTKKENEEKCREEIRQNVLRNTGPMFTEFETSVRDGLLEQLEGSPEGEAPKEEIEEVVSDEQALPEEIEEFEELEEFWEAEEQDNDGQEKVVYKDEAVVRQKPVQEEKPVWSTEQSAEEQAGEAADEEDFLDVLEAEEPEKKQEEPTGNTGARKGHKRRKPGVTAEDAALSEDKAQTEAGAEEKERPEDGLSEEQEPVECEREKIRGLSREEKELYAPFVQSRNSREQLVKAIDSISMAAYTGNIVITGDEGMDTLTLAKNMIREVKMTDRNFSGKVAKITGQGLNQKKVKEILEELNNGALIIQDAAGMSKETASDLYRALQQERTGIIIAMEDTKKAMQKLFLGTPELYGCFTARMDLEAFSNDTLVSFGRRYAREMEFSIDDLGVLALHTRIEELQTIDHVVTVIEVKKIVDEAIRHAKKKTLGHFLDVLLAKRYDDEDMIILTEKDFVA